jgi:hypothetical protein
METNNRDRLNWLFAGLVTITAFIVYFKTMAVSVSLWDCGEFIACSRILGIAHPPGTPLFIIFGRIFSMISFLGTDIAHRITFVSVISSAFAAGFAYLAVAKIISWWIKDKSSFINRLPMYIGGIVGALMMAFSRTWWTNAVEAEVYGLTSLATIIAIYLALVWFEKRDDPKSDKYLFLMIFVAMLGVAAHLAAFIPIPAIFLFMFIASPRLLKEPRVWITLICASALLINFSFFIWATYLWLLVIVISAYSEKEFDWSWMAVFLVFLVLSLIVKDKAPAFSIWFTAFGLAIFIIRSFTGITGGRTIWQSAFAVFVAISLILMHYSMGLMVWLNLILLPVFIVRAFMAKSFYWKWALSFSVLMALAFSVQYTVLVRAQERPRINMTDANTLSRMSDYLARKQYGQGNMIARMFHRRGTLAHQFGDYPRMGMFGFWEDQYSGTNLPFVIWFFVGLWGIYYSLKTKGKSGLMVFLIILAGTVGITLYMNFADGTQEMIDPNAKLEVRDRDYFWTDGFGLFGWAIGFGIAGFLQSLTNYLRSKHGMQKFVIPVSVIFCFAIFLPGFAIAKNYHYNDRSGEWLPYQFAHDMLSACGENAVLFTAGDNDTYPLWALQEAYKFRQDVKIINLSLANVDWYVLHCKEVFGAPMAIDRDQVQVKNIKTPGGIERRPEEMYYDPFIKGKTYFGSRPIRDVNGQFVGYLEMAQLVIEKVVEASLKVSGPSANKFDPVQGDTMVMQFPVYFTSLTDPVQKMRFREQYRHLERVTDLYKIMDTVVVGETPGPQGAEPFVYNVPETYRMLNNVFIFSGMGDPRYARGEFTTMMVHRYYGSEYELMIDTLLARNDTTWALSMLDKAINLTPENPNWPKWKVYRDSLEEKPADKRFEYQQEYLEYMRTLLKYHPDNYYYRQFISDVLFRMGQQQPEGTSYIQEGLDIVEEGYKESPHSQWLFENLLKGYVVLENYDELQKLLRNYYMGHPRDYYAPVYIVIADYMNDKQYKNLEIIARAYFSVVGMQTEEFRQLISFTLSRRDLEAFRTIQQVYFGLYPNDNKAIEFLNNLYGGQQPQQ